MQRVQIAILFIGFVIAGAAWVFELDFAPLLSLLTALLTLVAYLATNKPKREIESLDQRNRRVMLDHVENFWIKGVLEKSLHGVALMELGIREEPGAVGYPWTIKKESTDEALPAGKSMLDIFQEIGLGRSLLILGAPGSGKTTMLLALTQQLIQRARLDEAEPIPVIFNLASWKENQTLAGWLADELNDFYRVPKQFASAWVKGNKMQLLLDGLDEVKENNRAKCVEAINQFRKAYGLTAIVIGSRSRDYAEIKTRLSFEGAIALQPLSSEQIDAYLDRFGNSLSSIRLLLGKDDILKELAETPLMLSIMTLAYRDMRVDELVALGIIETQRKHLFDTYIDRMFQRTTRLTNADFTKSEALHYLSWLARTMIRHNLITYQIETMQPSWLEKRSDVRLHKLYGVLSGALIFGLSGALIFGLLGGLMGGLSGGLIFGLFSGLIFGLSDRIIMVDTLKWSWAGGRTGLLGGLIVGLSGGLIFGLNVGLSVGLSVGLVFGLIGGLIAGLIGGLTVIQVEETTYPGQRLRQTLYNGLIISLIVGLIGVPIGGLIGGLSGGLVAGLIGGPIAVPIAGLLFGLTSGYDSLIQHYLLRWLLTRRCLLPRQLISFLEYAVGLIFLHRVGGSYVFIHRLLMEHLAEMEIQTDKLET